MILKTTSAELWVTPLSARPATLPVQSWGWPWPLHGWEHIKFTHAFALLFSSAPLLSVSEEPSCSREHHEQGYLPRLVLQVIKVKSELAHLWEAHMWDWPLGCPWPRHVGVELTGLMEHIILLQVILKSCAYAVY